MPNGSIYVPQDDKFDGSSPQGWYIRFWMEARPARLKRRRWIAGFGAVAGVLLAIRFSLNYVVMAVLGAAIAAGADTAKAWWELEKSAVWRGKRRGEVRTGRLLRRRLRRYGYHVLDGRAVPGQASVDHLVIGPGGVWCVDNEAWAPDVHIARYGKRLFFEEKFGSKTAEAQVASAAAIADVLSRESGLEVEVRPLIAVHGGVLLPGDEEPRGTVTAEGVTLAYPRAVPRWILANEHASYTDEQVDLLSRTAARILRRMMSTL